MNKRAIQEKTGDSGGHRHRVLVIDGSRVVRATLAKRLADRFDIVEEANGESAWQRLMLEGNIAAVISGIHPPRLDARDLLTRLRSSAMRRLREIPFVLIVSDIENQTTSESAEWKDVTGFITKSMSADTMAAHLDQWLASSLPDVEKEPRVAKKPLPAADKSDKLLGSQEFSARVSSLTFSSADTVPVCVLVLGIDGLDDLVVRFGQDVPDLLRSRIASPLAEKIDPRDQLGLLGEQRLAIISYGVDLRQGARFGKRVCKSLASGQIAIRGQKIRMTVSIGIASTSDDAVTSGAELLALAEQRLEREYQSTQYKILQRSGEKVPATPEELVVEEDDKAVLLEGIYRTRLKQQPPAEWKELPDEERTAKMRAAVLQSWAKSELLLRQLGQARAASIKDYLVERGGLEDQRIYLLDVGLVQEQASAQVASAGRLIIRVMTVQRWREVEVQRIT